MNNEEYSWEMSIWEDLYDDGYVPYEDEEVEVESKGWETPMSTEYIRDKDMDYEVLGLITLFSLRSHNDNYRYLYDKGQNSLTSNMEEMEKMSQNKRRNIKRAIKKLSECDNDVVAICEDKKGRMYYKISPHACGEGRKGHFVTVNSQMLEFLINTSNTNVIKTYCAIKILLWDNKQQCYIKRPLTEKFLLRFIGLSDKSKKNIQQMSDILTYLALCGFIERKECTVVEDVHGEKKVKTTYTYELTTYDEWYGVKKQLKLGSTKLLRSGQNK